MTCWICDGTDFERLSTLWSPQLPGVRLPVVICRSCGLVAARSNGNSFESFNTAWFSREAAEFESSPHAARRWEKFWQRIEPYYANRIGVALDIGARHGEALALVKSKDASARILALELVPGFHARLTALGAEIITSPIEAEWPAELQSAVDLVIFRHTLEHLDQPQKALRNIRSVLRPGGMAYIAVPNLMAVPSSQPMRTDFFRAVHAHYFSEATLIGMAAKADLYPVVCKAGGEVWGLFSANQEYRRSPTNAYAATRAFVRERLRQSTIADAKAIAKILVRRSTSLMANSLR
jgi:SAM-dependent methyltransferase